MIVVNIKRLDHKNVHNQIIISSKGKTQKCDGVVSWDDLEAWRQVFETAGADPDFKIIAHPGMDIQVTNITDE